MSQESAADLRKRARGIKLFVLDVDGVMTDGKIILDDNGVESKNFNVRDGMGISLAIRKGYHFAIISGRYSKVVEVRAKELGIKEVIQGAGDKSKSFDEVLKKLGVSPESAAFIGDDINDVPVMVRCGLSAAPADADDEAIKNASFVSKRSGGDGAVRELVELVLKEQGNWGLDI